MKKYATHFVLVSLALLSPCARAPAVSPTGDWDAFVVTPSGQRVDFRLRVERQGDSIKGVLLNGGDRSESSSGSFDGRSLHLRFDYYDAELVARFDNQSLEGSFSRQWRRETLTRVFSARRGSSARGHGTSADFSRMKGNWVMRVGEGAAMRASELALTESDGQPRGTVLTVSGDWGAFTGRLENGELILTRFDGINARVIKGRWKDGRLTGTIDLGTRAKPSPFVAEPATTKNLKDLTDPSSEPRVRNRSEPFRFSFADLDGALIASTDVRFRDKVVIVAITGSWCPNCHDEAPFLEELYRRYRGQGLEIVGLAFEYTGDSRRDAEQVRAFVRRHGISFPILLAGTTDDDDVERKLPQLENFSGYPTTIFVGRDGLVKRIHTGFDGQATGERSSKLKAEIEELVKSLLDT